MVLGVVKLPHGRKLDCVCECGVRKLVAPYSITTGESRSCGCLHYSELMTRTHGRSKTPEYRVWNTMWFRCTNPKCSSYKFYGARGIVVCDRWKHFENFIADMGDRPAKGYSIERIDGSKGYEPGNCRWATAREQASNTRNTVLLEYEGLKLSLAEWARRVGVTQRTIWLRRKAGKSVAEILKSTRVFA
jgi:hypothetical protein